MGLPAPPRLVLRSGRGGDDHPDNGWLTVTDYGCPESFEGTVHIACRSIVLAGSNYTLFAAGSDNGVGGTTDGDGTVSFPGDRVEPGEELGSVRETAADREAREEVGIGMGEPAYLWSVSFLTAEGAPVVNVVFLCP